MGKELYGLKILVVDDDVDTRELIEWVLRRVGAEVTSVGSAREALEALEREKPHILVTDIAMPEEVEVAVVADPPAVAEHAGPAGAGVAERPEPRVTVPVAPALTIEARDRIALGPGRRKAEILALVRPIERSEVVGVLEDTDLPHRLLGRRLVPGGLLSPGGRRGGETQGQAGQERRRRHRLHDRTPSRAGRPDPLEYTVAFRAGL